MAAAHYHPNDQASCLTPSARAFVADMIAKGLKQQTHEDCIFMVCDPDPRGWRLVFIDSVEALLDATSHLKSEG